MTRYFIWTVLKSQEDAETLFLGMLRAGYTVGPIPNNEGISAPSSSSCVSAIMLSKEGDSEGENPHLAVLDEVIAVLQKNGKGWHFILVQHIGKPGLQIGWKTGTVDAPTQTAKKTDPQSFN